MFICVGAAPGRGTRATPIKLISTDVRVAMIAIERMASTYRRTPVVPHNHCGVVPRVSNDGEEVAENVLKVVVPASH